MTLNTEVSIEGLVAALGICGAAIGYIVSLFHKKKEKREKADRLTIMEILEREPVFGLSETQIKIYFESDETANFRKKAGANKPSKLKDTDYAIYIRDLQWASMIDQIDKDKYRLRVRRMDYELVVREKIKSLVEDKLNKEQVVQILLKKYTDASGYEKDKHFDCLIHLDPKTAVDTVLAEINPTDSRFSLEAFERISKYLFD